MEQYNVTGMSCAACSAHVEKAVKAVPGVTTVMVNLLTNSMSVEGTASENDIVSAVVRAGYGASRKGGSAAAAQPDTLEDTETPKMLKRLAASLLFVLVLMYISMGHMMWGWPLPGFLEDNHVGMGLAEMLLAIIVMIINQKFFVNGFRGAIHGAPNMDTLVAMGSAVSFLWSVYILFAMTVAQTRGDMETVESLMMQFYFESAAMILALITVGKTLESYSRGRTTDALKSLMQLAPKTALLIRDGREEEVPVEQVRPGDHFAVRPGDSIPVDGIVVEGSSAVDESALTGESIPADKAVGDAVSAATINRSGYLRCEATRVGEDTALSQIISMVSDAAATKAPISRTADRVSGIFVPAVLLVALAVFLIWMLTGQTVGFALARAISVLVISCPCALGLATPVAIMVGNGLGARSGILFKTAASLEAAGRVQIVALDKTGTITSGHPKVTDLIPADGCSEEDLLRLAAALEAKSEHPLAQAVMDFAEERNIQPADVTDFRALAGNGLTAVLGSDTLTGGSMKFIGGQTEVPEALRNAAEKLADAGKTPLCFLKNNQVAGLIAVADTMKEDSAEAIAALKNMGVRVVMLTGDNKRTARAIGAQAGVDEVIAGVLPDGKEAVIRKLQEKGKVAMVGDGINDAPALTRADTGIAIGAGTDVAIDAADVVLMNSRLSDVPAAVRLSRATLRNIHENLGWAFIYNLICIPVAAGLFIHINGWAMNPMLGALAMSLSSVCVVTNALRLNLFDVHSAKKDRRIRGSLADDGEKLLEEVEETPEIPAAGGIAMTKTIAINGMMCNMCEKHVKNALEALPGVEEAVPNHEANKADLTLSAEVAAEDLKKAVEEAGYEYVG